MKVAVRGVFLAMAIWLFGCASTVEIRPTLPLDSGLNRGQAKVGVYLPPGTTSNVYKNKMGSGIWPGTEYGFSPGETIQEDLFNLTKRHYQTVGYAESSLDKQWDMVIEYYLYPPAFEEGTLKAQAPLRLTLRDTRSGMPLEEIQLFGRSAGQSGRAVRFVAGQPLEKRDLQKALTAAYNDLYRQVDKTLARTVALGQSPTAQRPNREQPGGPQPGRNPSGYQSQRPPEGVW